MWYNEKRRRYESVNTGIWARLQEEDEGWAHEVGLHGATECCYIMLWNNSNKIFILSVFVSSLMLLYDSIWWISTGAV
jgi:hypothetical protein